ncbi:MAG: class IV adenylate cyclase [Rhizobiaceae bacterium]
MPKAEITSKGMLCDPGDHFSGRFEAERKYRVSDLDEFRRLLAEAGAVPFALENRETDIFLDTENSLLQMAGRQMVLRHMVPSDRVLWIIKGLRRDECAAVDMSDFDKARAMFVSLGYRETGTLEKFRDIYFMDTMHITLDRVPELGDFVEVSAMTDDEAALERLLRDIDELATRFGMTSSIREMRSYRELLGA